MAVPSDTTRSNLSTNPSTDGRQGLAAGELVPWRVGGKGPQNSTGEQAAERPPLALRGLAVFEAAKGGLALAATCGVLSLRHTDLHIAADAFMLHHGIDPERHFTRLFIESIARATHHHVGQIAAFGFGYALIRFTEGYGLWRGKHWAEWFAVISAGLYLPFEIWHLTHRLTLFKAGVILFNCALVIYLAKLLAQQRAQRHAHRVQDRRPHPPPTERS